jgi:tetratricopeptide (TPR) repeat protein
MFGCVAYILVFMVMTYNRCEVWKNGETLWTDVIGKFPGQTVVPYSNRGIAYTSSGQWDNAIADFTEAIAINSKYPVSYANRGIVYGNLGEPEKAIADFTKAIEIDPKYTLAFHNRGVAYVEIGENNKAVSDLSRAIKLDPKYISAYNNLSLLYQKNHLDSAISICLDGLKINPESALLRVNLGNCYLEKGDIGNAVIQFNKCLETNEGNVDALLGMAVASFLKNEMGYANGYISQAQSVEPVLNEGMTGIEKLEKAGYSFSERKKEILAKLFSQMK